MRTTTVAPPVDSVRSAVDSLTGTTLLAVLLYGAIWDARKRIIPDCVPVMLLILGFSTMFAPDYSDWHVPLSERMAGFLLPTVLMLVLCCLGKPVGGGDLKLCASLGFLLGLGQFALAYAVGAVFALVWAVLKKQRSVPLAVFLTTGVMICLLL